jgi:5-methylcytosine-specific restriction endonuclease McrA
VFVEGGVPNATVSGMLNISGREVWDIVATDPISLFECLECNKPLAVRGLNDVKRMQRALDAARNAAPGSRGSAHLFCGVCTEAVLGRLNEQGRRDRLALDARLYELTKMSYEEYLQTSEWRAKKIAALGWAKHRCQLCNSGDEELHVHHRVYTRRGCERLEDLIVLCSTHHRQFHGVEDEAS